MELVNLIQERRSANNFIEGIEIPRSEFDEIFRLVTLTPSCYNLQHVNYLVIDDAEKKEQLMEVAFKQYKIHTASAAVLVLGSKEANKDANKIYEGMLSLGILNQTEYNGILQIINSLYEGRGEEFKVQEAIRNASLSAMMFMLIAKDRGWDTCPMIGFDPEAVKKLFNVPDKFEPVLLITIGKEDKTNRRLRGYRKPIQEFVNYNGFNK
ncbi:nitroreductase family protein [Clostridium gasigenes]|uniref:nitroreductase family protein n=1 Tax=Clostridium gasigenes TaxID=94869 RepID=UPI001C0DFDD5|nr:nitroreductase family protein [Clostridium gasigenes]MBU3136757.1 nitroreductase family protein [Clostridium gasigenes]